jgi:catechol 2,3-dioxygenase-like lactoylglutathione lyase family enzyme
MFSTCMPTLHVSDVDSSVRFYTEVLGLKLAERYGNHWASVQAGSVKIGLHPASAQNPAGRNGSITIGFVAVGSLEEIVRKLEVRGVRSLHRPSTHFVISFAPILDLSDIAEKLKLAVEWLHSRPRTRR